MLNAIYLVRSLSRWNVNAFCLVCPVILNGRLGMTSGLLAILKGESECTVCGLRFACPGTKLRSVNPSASLR
jgi:hypothetical protein